MAAYPCTRCGACCRRVDLIPGFPEPARPDGSCSRLLPDNSCAIYETRPAICRLAPEDEPAAYAACETLIRHFGLPARLIPKRLIVHG